MWKLKNCLERFFLIGFEKTEKLKKNNKYGILGT